MKWDKCMTVVNRWSTVASLSYFRVFQISGISCVLWAYSGLKLCCITNMNMLFLVMNMGFVRLVNEIRFLLFCITSTVVCLVPAFYKLKQSSQCKGTKRNGGKNEWIMFFNPLTLNFKFLFQSLTKDNIIQYGEFGNSLVRWKLIEQSFLTTSLNNFLLGWSGEFALWAWDWKG